MSGIIECTWQSKVLTTDDHKAWRALVETIPAHDAFFMPEYILPFERLSGEKAHLFLFGNAANYIVYPFFLRRISELPFYQAFPLDDEAAYYDIVSPYGYSGPLACVRDQSCQSDLWQRYLAAFHHYCQEANIVCEFARLNPFTGNQQYLQALTDGVQACNQIIYLDLTLSEETLWRGLNRGNRSNINKARRAGVRVARDDQGEHVQSFYELYLATMHRNQATSWYDFSPDFFTDSFTLLGDKISLFYATYHDQVIAAASFLHAGEVVHYFLGGSDSNYLDLRPNNLLMYQAICWAKNQGYRFFNLGGDYGSKGSLARFKAAFSKLSTTFYTYRMIHNCFIYNELCRKREAFDRLNSNHQQDDINYFPLYRANTSG